MRSDSTFLVQFGGQQLIIDSIPAAVYDSEGNAYYILADGTVEYRFIGSISEDELAASDTLHVNFKHYNEQNYGFDAFDNGLWPESYETIELNDGYKSLDVNIIINTFAKTSIKKKIKFLESKK